MVRDPICGMNVEPHTARFSTHRNGQIYYFCSQVCKDTFAKNSIKNSRKKGLLTRFLEWIARANKEKFHGEPPSCCGH